MKTFQNFFGKLAFFLLQQIPLQRYHQNNCFCRIFVPQRCLLIKNSTLAAPIGLKSGSFSDFFFQMVDIDNIVVGVDIGTSNLSVALYLNGFIRVLEDDNRGRITPSYAFFDKQHNCVVGSWAQFKTDKRYNNFGIYGNYI